MALLSLLGGCGGAPMPFPTPPGEMGNAPGLLSGPDGQFVLYPRDPPQRR